MITWKKTAVLTFLLMLGVSVPMFAQGGCLSCQILVYEDETRVGCYATDRGGHMCMEGMDSNGDYVCIGGGGCKSGSSFAATVDGVTLGSFAVYMSLRSPEGRGGAEDGLPADSPGKDPSFGHSRACGGVITDRRYTSAEASSLRRRASKLLI